MSARQAVPNTSHSVTQDRACPLCASNRVAELDKIPVQDLCAEFLRQLKFSISNEFPANLQELYLSRCEVCGLQFFWPLITGTPEFYARLSTKLGAYYNPLRWEFQRAHDLLPKGSTILDVGCGDGEFISRFPPGKAVGIEFNPSAIKKARAKVLDVSNSSLEALPDSSFDAVTVFQVMEHVSHPVGLLRQACRVLRSGGELLIAVPDNDGFMGRIIQEPLNAPPHHVLRWRAQPLEYLPNLLPLRLERLEREPLSDQHLLAYRRTLLTELMGKVRGHPFPLFRLSRMTIAARRLANLITRISLLALPRLKPSSPEGHSIFGAFRKL